MVGVRTGVRLREGEPGVVVVPIEPSPAGGRSTTWRAFSQSACAIALLALLLSGCRTGQAPVVEFRPTWDISRAEILEWHADDAAFNQDHALEASGLAIADDRLFVPSEKYGTLLVIDMARSMAARVVALRVPRYAELEGIAVRQSTAYLCDEAHATVHEVDLSDLERGWALPSRRLHLQGLTVQGGKIGFEGVAVTPDGRFIYLLLERSSRPGGGCESKVFKMRVSADVLKAEGRPILVSLEDCTWRLTGLDFWHGRLLALKSKFPGNRYEVIAIDPDGETWETVLDLTEKLRSVTEDRWGNNVEGIAVGGDGALYLVSDNAVTGVIDDPEPPPTDERTLLLKIPSGASEGHVSSGSDVSAPVHR